MAGPGPRVHCLRTDQIISAGVAGCWRWAVVDGLVGEGSAEVEPPYMAGGMAKYVGEGV